MKAWLIYQLIRTAAFVLAVAVTWLVTWWLHTGNLATVLTGVYFGAVSVVIGRRAATSAVNAYLRRRWQSGRRPGEVD